MQHDPDEEDQNAETLVEHSNSDVASESNESTSGSDDEIGSDEEDGEVEDEDPEDNSVDVTLEFFDPKEADFHGLKALLQSYLDGEAYSCSDLVDVIIKQVTTPVLNADILSRRLFLAQCLLLDAHGAHPCLSPPSIAKSNPFQAN